MAERLLSSTTEYPSKRQSPPMPPNQRNPSSSCSMALIVLLGRPSITEKRRDFSGCAPPAITMNTHSSSHVTFFISDLSVISSYIFYITNFYLASIYSQFASSKFIRSRRFLRYVTLYERRFPTHD